MLTEEEHEAIHLAGQLYSYIADKVCGMGVPREDDLAEVRHHIHAIQHAIMAQAAARAHPDELRLMGEVVGWQAPK